MKIFALEVTNNCNAKCSFCPHSNNKLHTRKKGYLSIDAVYRILKLISSDTMAINGLGEPLLHPKIDFIVRLFTENNIKVQLNSNGKLLNQEMYDKLYEAGLYRLVVTKDYFGWDKNIKQEDNLKIEIFTITGNEESNISKKDLDDWGGRLGSSNRNKVPCSFIEDNWIQILWNGDIVRCCVDFNSEYKLGNIYNDIKYDNKLIPFCQNCKGYRFKNALVVGDYEGEYK